MSPRGRQREPEVFEEPLKQSSLVTSKVVASKSLCRHCGADPRPTRDGIHKCQCRMEKV